MEYLKIAHGLFNIVVVILLVRQGLHGLKIRSSRRGSIPDMASIREHRRNGPVLACLVLTGYLAGVLIAFVNHGRIGHNFAHFFTGTLLLSAIGAAYLVSRQIRGAAPGWRTLHSWLGVTTLVLSLIQVLLGLGALL